MSLKQNVDKAASRVAFWLRHLGDSKFECPICNYTGPFKDMNPPTGRRRHALCPQCQGLERHRLQYVALTRALTQLDPATTRVLHVAPEPFFRTLLSSRFPHYETADLAMPDVDHNVDLQNLPFADQSYELVFASHVLEHVPDDHKAVAEIRRILCPGGIAILPVPIVAHETVEYPEPNPHEEYHVRAPGLDYYERYNRHFSRVETLSSNSVPEAYQPFVYEDRSQWPTRECPLRPPMIGARHIDIVPVCYA